MAVEFIGVHDLILRGGLCLQWLLNLLFPLTRRIEKMLLKTPLRRFAHHLLVIARKTGERPSLLRGRSAL